MIRPAVFEQVIDRLRREQPRVPALFAPLDLHHVRLAAHATVSADAALAEASEGMRIVELAALERADATIILSTEEVARARELAPAARVVHVPIARDPSAPSAVTSWSHGHDLVFVGSYRHLPNVDGVHWFLDEVWPDIVDRLPDARFVAYGSGLPDDLVARANDRVIMHGFVERLADAFETARIGVVPLRFGAGVKGKVATTMLAGIPVVSTAVGVEGMDIGGDAVVVATDARSLADVIVNLWTDEERLSSISAAALDHASTRFSFAAQRTAIAAVLADLAGPERR